MGIFDSDYEAQGTVSVSQVGVQRAHDDTYFGELLLMKNITGRNTADEIRYDIMQGVTATWRKYGRIAKREEFYIKIGDETSDGSGTDPLSIAKIEYPTAISVNGRWGSIDGKMQAVDDISKDPSYDYHIVLSSNFVSSILIGGVINYVVSEDYSGATLVMKLEDGSFFNTGIITSKPEIHGYFGVLEINSTRSIYWISTDSRLETTFNPTRDIEGYPVVSLQDNGNNEEPYYELGSDHEEYKRRHKVIDSIGVDFEELSKSIFNPDEIPELGTTEWEPYKSSWLGSDDLQEKYPSEESYRNFLVESREAAIDSTKNITDAHFGMFISAGTLDWSNIYVLKAFYQEAVDAFPAPNSKLAIGEIESGNSQIDIVSGTLKITHYSSNIFLGRILGTISNFEEDIRLGNIAYEPDTISSRSLIPDIKMLPKNRGAWGTADLDLGGSLAEVIYGDSGCIAIAFPAADTDSGESTYEYLIVRNPVCYHHVDVLRDGDHGTNQNVVVKGSLKDIGGEEYSDVMIWPITKTTLRMVPIFKRERLMRESTSVIISGIHVTEVKWYEQGIWQVIITIVVVVVSCYLTACAGTAAYSLAGASATVIIENIAIALVVGFGLEQVLGQIDDPFLAALLVVVIAVATGKISSGEYLKMATLAVEATGTYVQKKTTQELIEMKEKYDEFAKTMNDKIKELEDLMEEAGINNSTNTEFALNRMLLPPAGEHAEDFFARTTNTDFAIINQDDGIRGKSISKLPKTKFA